jgi:Amt family ammonium transporter
MVWFWTGPDAIKDAATAATEGAKAGFLFQKGALDFAGGTVVHINAAVAGLVGAYMIGKRVGYGRESMAPHSLDHDHDRRLAAVGRLVRFQRRLGAGSCRRRCAWPSSTRCWPPPPPPCPGCCAEWIFKGKPSMLGAASGAVAGLVAITPACGFVGPMGALVIGLLAGVVCLWGVNGLKRLLGADDSLDVFGVHGVGGILGALLTGVFASPSLGGQGIFDYVTNKMSADPYSIAGQVTTQATAIGATILWSGVVSLIAYKLVDVVIGLRVPEEEEREGLDITSSRRVGIPRLILCLIDNVALGPPRRAAHKAPPKEALFSFPAFKIRFSPRFGLSAR